jgi:hypothetical protein
MILFLYLRLVYCIETEWLSSNLSPIEMIKIYDEYLVDSDQSLRSRNMKTGNVLAYVTPWNSKGISIASLISRI